jgi:prefoldin subunit 5
MSALETIGSAVETIRVALEEISEEAGHRQGDLSKLNDEIVAAQEDLGMIRKSVAEETERHRLLIQKNTEELRAAQGSLEKATEELGSAQAELSMVKKKHAQYVEFQVRGNKALEARESAVSDREKAHKLALAQSRRVTSVLNQMD